MEMVVLKISVPELRAEFETFNFSFPAFYLLNAFMASFVMVLFRLILLKHKNITCGVLRK